MTDVKIDFYDGKMHPVDSKDIAFQIAGYFAFKEAFTAARPCLLEPIETVEIRIPEDCMGKVMGDLSSGAAKFIGMDTDGAFQVIKAQRAGQGTLPLFQHAAFADRRARRAHRGIQPLRGNAARRGGKGD